MTGMMIITLIVSLLACGAVFIVVDSLANGVMKRMKKEVFRYIKQYNEQMQDGSVLQGTVAASTVTGTEGLPDREENLAIPFVPKAQPMQKKDFFCDYRKLRESFPVSQEQVIARIPPQEASVGEKFRLVCDILDKLSFDNLYEIGCLSEEKQLLVLDDILDEGEKEILSAYREECGDTFDCAKFYTYLKNKQAEYDDTIYCFVGMEDVADGDKDGRVKPCADQALLEGFQLLHGGYLYDYGVRSSELR